MKNRPNRLTYLWLVLTLSLLSIHTQAQQADCYQTLFPAAGFTLDSDSIGIKSCALREAFPEEDRSDFGVYSSSQYALSEYYAEDFIPDVVSSLGSQAGTQTPFYLLFYWSRSGLNLFGQVDISIELPADGPFQCTSELKRAALVTKLEHYAGTLLNAETSTPAYVNVEEMVIDSLRKFVEKAIECCSQVQKTLCSECLDQEDVNGLFDRDRTVVHIKEYEGTNGTLDYLAGPPPSTAGSNYSITELDPVFITWDGQSTRLSTLMANYFETVGVDANWDAVVVPNELCNGVGQDQFADFLGDSNTNTITSNLQKNNSPEITHKVLATIKSDGSLLVKVSSNSWLYHPVDFTTFQIHPINIVPATYYYEQSPVLSVRKNNEQVPFGAYTPAGTIISFPPGVIASFFPRKGEWPAGCVNGFSSEAKLYWGTWDETRHVFLGYRCIDYEQAYTCETTYFLPYQETPELLVAATARGGDGCKIEVYQDEWKPEYNLKLHKNESEANPSFEYTVVSDITLPPSSGEIGILPNPNCLESDTAYCRTLYTYRNHPYMTDDGPLGRVVRKNPCILASLTHYNIDGIQGYSEYTDGLSNICAVGLAAAFSPVIVAEILPALIGHFGKEKLKNAAIGFAIDLLLQGVINYYFILEGEEKTWPKAFKNPDLYQSSASAIEGLLSAEGQSQWAARAITAASSCLVDGLTERGELRDGFSAKDCAIGAVSALLIGEIINQFSWVKTRLQSIPKEKFADGIAALIGDIDPSIHLNGFNVPIGYILYKFRNGVDLETEDIISLFKISSTRADEVAQKLNSDPQLKALLLESDWWAGLRNTPLSKELRGEFLADLVNDVNFASQLSGVPNAARDKMVKAWEVVSDVDLPPFIKATLKDISYYEKIFAHLSTQNLSAIDILASVQGASTTRRKISQLGLDLDDINDLTGTFGHILHSPGVHGVPEGQLISEFTPGPTTGFTGVINFRHGEFSMAPSDITDISNSTFTELLPRNGGHAQLANSIFEETEMVAGFALHYVEPGKLEVSWLSGMNRNRGYGFPPPGDDRMLRHEYRGYITNALSEIYPNIQIIPRP